MRHLLTLSALALGFILVGPQVRAAPLAVGDSAPCVVLNNVAANGSESEHCIRDPEVAGQAKILEFFSATCGDCTENLPIVSQLAARVKAEATTRLVGIDRSESVMRDFIKNNHQLINFDVALDMNREAKRAYDIVETPTIFVLDAHNKVLYRSAGVLSAAEVEQIVGLVGGH